MPQDINTPEWLNKQFIEQALREGEKNNKLMVRKINVRSATSAGDNYASIMYRVAAEYSTQNVEGAIHTKSLIVKALPEAEHAKSFVLEKDGFTTETQVLRIIIPAIHNLLNYSSLDRSVTLAAKCYYHTDKPDQKLVLEDLCESGFKMAQKHVGLDLDHCKLVMSHLAMFHAASVALHRRDQQSFDKFLKYAHLRNADATKTVIQYTFDTLAEYLMSWSEIGKKYSDKLHHLWGDVIQRLENSVQRDDEGFNVLNHGDAWVNNTMFRYSEDGNPSDVIFVDFQFCYYGSPAIDLQYFLNSSPNANVRSNHMDELLEFYHSSLFKTLTKLGIGDKCPSLVDIHREIQKRSFVTIFTSISIRPLVFVRSENIPDLETIIGDEQKTDTPSYLTEQFTNEIVQLLPIFDKKCWLD